jgi:hypothetical protein
VQAESGRLGALLEEGRVGVDVVDDCWVEREEGAGEVRKGSVGQCRAVRLKPGGLERAVRRGGEQARLAIDYRRGGWAYT